MNAKIGIFLRWNEIGSSFMRCLVTMFYKVEMLKTAAVGNWKRKLYVVAKKWQQLNERSNQISQVSPICILDIQIKVMFKKHSLKIYGPFSDNCNFFKADSSNLSCLVGLRCHHLT